MRKRGRKEKIKKEKRRKKKDLKSKKARQRYRIPAPAITESGDRERTSRSQPYIDLFLYGGRPGGGVGITLPGV